ncbi:hypothetical protein FMN50_20365 [Rhodobacterales bacterium]|nr:hypothetical protein FMN50_20365 [Rhodobacterales bacterium]
MTDAFWQIERKRRQLGLSANKLTTLAGINSNHYSDLVARKKHPRADTIAKLKIALSRHERGEATTLPAMIYRLCLLSVCMSEGVKIEDVLSQEPSRRATFDPVWKRAADLRAKALYIAHTVCGVPQKQLAAATGLTPAAVSLAMGRVEDACEPEDVPLFRLVETAIGGL